MGVLLFFIAVILYLPLTVINLFAVLYKYGVSFKTANDYFKETAIDIDRFGNRNFRTLLNMTLKTKDGYKFGNERETISSALGKNKINNTLTKTGVVLCKILCIFDDNHCIKSIKQL